MSRNAILWVLWIVATLAVASVFATRLYLAGDRTAMLPGETTGVHHQFEQACDTCHKEDAFESTKDQLKAINKTCVTCHKAELNFSNDSHPVKKFKDPRMAELWALIDARQCTSCHLEHQPETTTVAGAVTLPENLCVACHSEGKRDVRVNRESHADIEDFGTCATAGCHNFHDNRALYEDFLVKHSDKPWLLEQAIHTPSLVSRERARPEDVETYLAAVEAPEFARDPEIEKQWAASAHALENVTCAKCHAPKAKTPEDVDTQWVADVPLKTCNKCHKNEVRTFTEGRHGIRSHAKIAKARKPVKEWKTLTGQKLDKDGTAAEILGWLSDPTPPKQMSVAEARVELHPDAHGELTCATCHGVHETDVQRAAVEACTTCHTDEHTRSYKDSKHYELWLAELDGELPAGSGVTCATCHMPRIEDPETYDVYLTHNQNMFLRPNEKMIRPVCMECHGLGFAIDALADPDLVERNFQGQPSVHIESIDWAMRRVEGEAQGANQ